MDTKEWVLAFLEKDYKELVRLGFSLATTGLDDLFTNEGRTFTEQLDKNLGKRFWVTLRTDNSIEDTNLWTIAVKMKKGGITRAIGFGGIKIREEVFVFFVANANIRYNPVTSNDWIAENAVAVPLKELYDMRTPEVCAKIQHILKSLWEKLLTVKADQEKDHSEQPHIFRLSEEKNRLLRQICS